MEYRIRVQPGKEKAFQQFIKALKSAGVIEKAELTSQADSHYEEEKLKQSSSSKELASQYRDLVD